MLGWEAGLECDPEEPMPKRLFFPLSTELIMKLGSVNAYMKRNYTVKLSCIHSDNPFLIWKESGKGGS